MAVIRFLRRRLLLRFSALFLLLQYAIVPNGPQEPMRFARYRFEHDGWIWFIFPKLVLRFVENVDLTSAAQNAVAATQAPLRQLANSSQQEIRGAVARSVHARAAELSASLEARSTELVAGSEQLPSAITTKGREATQAIHRSIVEAVGKVSAEHFEKVIRRSLAQMLAYAREEAGVVAEVEHALPLGTRFVSYGDPVSMFVVEEPPRVRTILWDNKPVTLSFPYVVFPIYISKGKFLAMQMFFRNEPLRAPSDKLYMPPLPDIMWHAHRNDRPAPELRYRFWVCFPGPDTTSGTPADIAKSAQEIFWSSNFRSGHWSATLQSKVQSMENFSIDKWYKSSKDNPGLVLKTNWLETPLTVEKLGKDLKPKEDKFDIQTSFSRLDKYSREIAARIATSMQEEVLMAIGASGDVKASRAAFDGKLKEAIAETNVAQKLAEIIREELKRANDGSEIDTIVATIAHKASTRVADIIIPAMANATSQMVQKLCGTTEKGLST